MFVQISAHRFSQLLRVHQCCNVSRIVEFFSKLLELSCELGAFAAIHASPDRWKWIAFFAAIGVVAGVVISANIRNRGVRQLRKKLHVQASWSSLVGTAILIFVFLAIACVLILPTELHK